MASNC